jgi:hypothetical protein
MWKSTCRALRLSNSYFNFTFSDVPKASGTERKFHNGLINWKNGNFLSFVGTESYVNVFLREIKQDLVCRAPYLAAVRIDPCASGSVILLPHPAQTPSSVLPYRVCEIILFVYTVLQKR